jgi:indoleamine 2,3-dioxygenase
MLVGQPAAAAVDFKFQAAITLTHTHVNLKFAGWRNNDVLPQGLIYEGLWGNQPQQLYGETGAQSTVVHALDAALGIKHKQGW